MNVLSDPQYKANIAENLRRLMASQEMTKYRLAKVTGENEATIGRVVKGQHMPGAGLLARIAEALDVRTDFLLRSPSENFQEVA